jgi:predicted phage terminase large subunit-like protein
MSLEHNASNEDAVLKIEGELIERELSFRRLWHFVRRSTAGFLDGWHIQELCAAVERIEQEIQSKRGTNARLIVEAPPRHGKSQVISRCTPLWYLGRHPEQEIILATYSQDLADDMGRWAKQALTDPSIRAIFPKLEIRKDSRAANRLDTTLGGGIRYVGVGGPITGRGANLAIIDDPIKGAEDADSEAMSAMLWDWYTSVLRTRLAPGGGIVILHTRWRVNDLIGRLRRLDDAGEGEHFRVCTFSAIAGPADPWGRAEGEPLHAARYDAKDLEALRLSLPPRDWLAMYQQSPMLEEGNVFKITDFNLYAPGQAPKNLNWYLSTDYGLSTKSSADPTALWPFGVDEDGCIWWAPDFVHGRMGPHESVKRTIELAKQYKVHAIIIEGGQIWRALEPEFKREMRKQNFFCQIINPAPTKDKFTRSRATHGRMSAGMMKYPDTRRMREMVMPEFLVFTGINDDHDEFVDLTAWAGVVAEQMILPVKDEEGDTEDAEDEASAGKDGWSYADMLRRCKTPERKRRSHVPAKLIGAGERKSGTPYRYA